MSRRIEQAGPAQLRSWLLQLATAERIEEILDLGSHEDHGESTYRLQQALTLFQAVENRPWASSDHADSWRTLRPFSFSCSSFVCWFYLEFFGIDLDAPLAGAFISCPKLRDRTDDFELGDILIYQRDDGGHHAMIFLGDALGLSDQVIGSCDVERRVLMRHYKYERKWSDPNFARCPVSA